MRLQNSSRKTSRVSHLAVGACVGTALLATGGTAFAQSETGSTVRMERLEKENSDLKKRLDMLEGMAQKEGLIAPNGAKPLVKALTDLQQLTGSRLVSSAGNERGGLCFRECLVPDRRR